MRRTDRRTDYKQTRNKLQIERLRFSKNFIKQADFELKEQITVNRRREQEKNQMKCARNKLTKSTVILSTVSRHFFRWIAEKSRVFDRKKGGLQSWTISWGRSRLYSGGVLMVLFLGTKKSRSEAKHRESVLTWVPGEDIKIYWGPIERGPQLTNEHLRQLATVPVTSGWR